MYVSSQRLYHDIIQSTIEALIVSSANYTFFYYFLTLFLQSILTIQASLYCKLTPIPPYQILNQTILPHTYKASTQSILTSN
jgi:hypothetical protein